MYGHREEGCHKWYSSLVARENNLFIMVKSGRTPERKTDSIALEKRTLLECKKKYP